MPEQPESPSESWELWYRDLFDRACPPSIDKSGVTLSVGLAELWARHLFEAVQRDGEAGFSSFTLEWRNRRLAIHGSAAGALRLRRWLFGEQDYTMKGYVSGAERTLLATLAAVHARLIDKPDITEQILLLAEQSPKRASFVHALHGLGIQQAPVPS